MKPNFDAWIVFFFVAAANSWLLAALLYFNASETERKTKRWLSVLLFLFGSTLFYYVCFWTNLVRYYIHLNNVLDGLPLLFGPVLLFYYQELTYKKVAKNWFAHLLPYAIVTLFHLPIIFQNTQNKLLFYQNLQNDWLWKSFFLVSTIIVTVSLLGYAAYFLKKYVAEKAFLNQFSDKKELQKVGWERGLFLAFALYALLCLLYYILVWTNVLTLTTDYFVCLGLVLCIYYIAFRGFSPPVFYQENIKQNEQYITTKQLIKEADIEYFKLKLRAALDERKLYLQKDLKMASLAENIGLSTHQLSYLINHEFEMPYADLINEYRINEAKRLLEDPEIRKEKLLRVAFDTGFSNKTSFINAFKKQTGFTPSEWRERVENNV